MILYVCSVTNLLKKKKMTISYIKTLKINLFYSLFFLLLFTACSKGNEENIRPIIDLPCEEQGTYFLSATIGDSVLCYASDSAFDNGQYSFSGSLGDLSNYYEKDTSSISVQVYQNDINKDVTISVQYVIPIYSKYELKIYGGYLASFYDRNALEESITNKTYYSQNLSDDYWSATPNFKVRIIEIEGSYNNWKASYFGSQDSSYIHLFNPVHLYDTEVYGGFTRSHYKVSYEVQSNLYDVSGNYLYPFTSKGNFQFSFFILN
jgi:hypothetical protein